MTDSTMRIEYGDKVWRNAEGKLHRLDGPARERDNGTKSWWVEGKRHRLDGPAIEWADGGKQWWVDGNKLTEKEFNERVGKLAPDSALCQTQGDDLWICRRRVHEGTTCYYFFEPVQKYEVKK